MLQTPYFDERTLRSYLGRLVINLEAQVVNSKLDGHDSPPGREVIYSGAVQDSEDPLIVVHGAEETDTNSGHGHILVVWKMPAFLVRPRLRLQNPAVVFSATASLKPAEQVQRSTLREEYLPSQIPSGINLLEVSLIIYMSCTMANSLPLTSSDTDVHRLSVMIQPWEGWSPDCLLYEYLELHQRLKVAGT